MRPLPSLLVLSSLIAACLVPAAAHAQETPPTQDAQSYGSDLTPGEIPQPSIDAPGLVAGVMLGQYYADNITLAAPGTPRDSSWVTLIRPFVRAATSGPRFSGVVNYSLAGYLYLSGPGDNQVAQSLNANGTLTVLPQHLFLDGYAQYGRRAVNNALPSASESFYLDRNQTNVGVGSLSPYWRQDLGKVGTMLVRYTLGRVVYNDRGIPDEGQSQLTGVSNVTSNTGQFSIVSPEGQRWGWDLGYSEQRLDYDSGYDVTFAMARVGTSYQVSNGFKLLADAGQETKFLPDGSTDKLGASFWDVGFEWASSRDHVRATVGHRFFGSSYSFAWSHEAARLTTNVSYTEQPTDYNQQLLGQSIGGGGLPPINVHPVYPSLTNFQPYVRKRLTLAARYAMPRGSLDLQVYDELRHYFDADTSDERIAGADIAWSYRLGARTALTPRFRWQRYKFQTGQVSYSREAWVALSHQFNPKNSGELSLRHRDTSVANGVPGAHGYRANTIYLQWLHLF